MCHYPGARHLPSEIDLALRADVLTVLQIDDYLPLLVQLYQRQSDRRGMVVGGG